MYLAILHNGHQVQGDSAFIRALQLRNKILYLIDDGENGTQPEQILDMTEILNSYNSPSSFFFHEK